MKALVLSAAPLLAVAALALAPPAPAGPGLLVGVDDDSLKWYTQTRALVSIYRDLGVGAVRVTLSWQPGQWAPTRADRQSLNRVNVAAWGMRVVVAVTGSASQPPLDDASRTTYCNYVANVLRMYPAFDDVVIWTEPNSPQFWQPQDGAAAAYEALLARCWDVLHAVRPHVNVIAASAPHQDPAAWFAGVGAALRASGRAQPIFDTVGHNAYPRNSAEPPSVQHKRGQIDEGDYDRLLRALRRAFAGTSQPLPGRNGVTIWYMEDGFQTQVDAARRVYSGSETDVHAVSEAAQAVQLAAAVREAACQPLVGAFFNFELRDETSLAGWQSGVLRADWSPKPSYAAFRSAIADVRAGRVACG
jgi:hypothetical protein